MVESTYLCNHIQDNIMTDVNGGLVNFKLYKGSFPALVYWLMWCREAQINNTFVMQSNNN